MSSTAAFHNSAPSVADIESLEWVRIPKGGTLNVRQENKPTSVFAGFRDQVRWGPFGCCTSLCTH
jgi:hypothetical protein